MRGASAVLAVCSKKREDKMPAVVDASLILRLKSALVIAPAFLLVVYAGGIAFSATMALMAAIGVQEWVRMVLSTKYPHRFLAPMAAGLTFLAVLVSGFTDNPATSLWMLFATCFLLFAFNLSQKGPPLGRVFFGVLYIGFSVQVMIWLRNETDHGLYHFLTLLFIIWASDIGAYFTGKAIGGPKLAPIISPKKTWAGFWGSSVWAALVAAGLSCPFMLEYFSVETIGGLTWLGYAAIGFILAMFGQAGDLFISMFKREYGIKDTGTLIPGHGGILDRIDALLLVAVLFGTLAFVLP